MRIEVKHMWIHNTCRYSDLTFLNFKLVVTITRFIGHRGSSCNNSAGHRVFTSELEIRIIAALFDDMFFLDKWHNLCHPSHSLCEAHQHLSSGISCGLAVTPADVHRHHGISFVIFTIHGPDIFTESVIRNPDMPAPHDFSIPLHCHNGIALPDCRSIHFELQPLLVRQKPDLCHQILLVLPEQDCIGRITLRIIIDIWIRNLFIEVILEMLLIISRGIEIPVLDSIAVNQRE